MKYKHFLLIIALSVCIFFLSGALVHQTTENRLLNDTNTALSAELDRHKQHLADIEKAEQKEAEEIQSLLEIPDGFAIPETYEWSYDTLTCTVVARVTQESILPREEIEYWLHMGTLYGSQHPDLNYWEYAYLFVYQAGESTPYYAAELFIPDKTVESGYRLFEPFDCTGFDFLRPEPNKPY